MEMTLWRIKTRHLNLAPSQRKVYSFVVATRSALEQDAIALGKAQYSDEWWKENLLQDVEEIGRLKAAEGFQIPQDELDY